MATISANVGKGGTNRPEDVKIVQELLNKHIARLSPLMPVPVTGVCDEQTILLIEEFQRRVMNAVAPDSRVDPGGRTLAKLSGPLSAASAGSLSEPVLDGVALPPAAAKVLKEILATAGISRAMVSSGSRTPAEQARVMYENCISKGAEFNRRLYAAAGDQVVDVFAANCTKSRDIVIQLMLSKIEELGPDKISKHASSTHFAFDVAPSSIPASRHGAFLQAARSHKAVSNVLSPPSDPAFHIEIPRNSPFLPT